MGLACVLSEEGASPELESLLGRIENDPNLQTSVHRAAFVAWIREQAEAA